MEQAEAMRLLAIAWWSLLVSISADPLAEVVPPTHVRDILMRGVFRAGLTWQSAERWCRPASPRDEEDTSQTLRV